MRQTARVVLTKHQEFFVFFIPFEWGRIFENGADKQKVNCKLESRPNYFL